MKYIHNFNWLRGMAACAIAFFHLGTGNARLIPSNNLFNQVTFYGYAGLFIFYVISGTVLPLSMEVGGYRLRDGFRFIGKRMLHIYPPFLASLVLVLFLNFISYMNPAFRGSREWNIERIIGNVFFMGDHFGGWLNIVYWALAVEVQFYLLMVFLYPVVISTCRPPWFAFFLLLQMPTICGWDVVFLKMLPVLLLGVVLYRYLSKRDNFFIFSLCSLLCSDGNPLRASCRHCQYCNGCDWDHSDAKIFLLGMDGQNIFGIISDSCAARRTNH